jgi:hypothetical protein
VLRLQAGLGLEQTTFLKEELQQMGYTPSEIEGEVELDVWETETEELTHLFFIAISSSHRISIIITGHIR